VKVLLFAMLINALHAALEDRIEALNRVGMDFAANVFLLGVLDAFVGDTFNFGDDLVAAQFVRYQARFAGEIGADDGQEIARAGAVNVEAASRTAAFNERKDRVL
jgi:hypothetical protein